MNKSRILVGCQLFVQFLVIQLAPKLISTIEYEMGVILCSMFAVDDSLLVCKEMSDLMNIIKSVPVERIPKILTMKFHTVMS